MKTEQTQAMASIIHEANRAARVSPMGGGGGFSGVVSIMEAAVFEPLSN
jgi:phosphoribosylaminoimidazole (AIR) synthetase